MPLDNPSLSQTDRRRPQQGPERAARGALVARIHAALDRATQSAAEHLDRPSSLAELEADLVRLHRETAERRLALQDSVRALGLALRQEGIQPERLVPVLRDALGEAGVEAHATVAPLPLAADALRWGIEGYYGEGTGAGAEGARGAGAIRPDGPQSP